MMQSLIESALDKLHKARMATRLGIVGAVAGAAVGVFSRRRRPAKAMSEDELEKQLGQLEANMQLAKMARGILPMLDSVLSSMEYAACTELERLGRHPCSRCGERHTGGGTAEAGCIARNTYWSTADQAYLDPEDELWNAEDYARARGHAFVDDGETDDDEGEDGSLH